MLRRSPFLMLLLLIACDDNDARTPDAGTPAADAGRRALDCPGVFDCVEVCADDDDMCVDDCIERASRSAAPAVNDVLACAERNECVDEACLARLCDSELSACAGAPAIDGGVSHDAGDKLDCAAVFDCVATCEDGDDVCADRCAERASSSAAPAVDDVLACAQRNDCTDEACLASQCEAELRACAGAPTPDAGKPDAGGADGGVPDAGAPEAAVGCDGVGKPEMTGPITGIAASYARGDRIDIGVPVDADTARVIVGIYEVGSTLYLGGTAEDVTPSTTAPLSLFAGVAGGKTGRFYLSVELCSTSVCTTPFIRNTYQRADRSAPGSVGETYVQTREHVGVSAASETCATAIPVQSFQIQ